MRVAYLGLVAVETETERGEDNVLGEIGQELPMGCGATAESELPALHLLCAVG